MLEYVDWPRQRTKNYQENLEISSTSSENESEVDDSKGEQSKAAKEEWCDKQNKSKRKRSSFYLNKPLEPIVLQPQAKISKVQKISKNRKEFQDAKKESLESRTEVTYKIQ